MNLWPKILPILEKLGFNTTRLKWRIHQRELEKEREAEAEKLPTTFRWLRYQNKFCPSCNGLVAGDERTCPHCQARVPSLFAYRIMRTIGIVVPKDAAAASFFFLGLIMVIFATSVIMDGGKIMRPTNGILDTFGAHIYWKIKESREYWRIFGSGLMHIGIIHIGFNSMFLVNVGPLIERSIGSKRMLALITFTSITSSLATQFWWGYQMKSDPRYFYATSAGASGWLMGLIGFGISYFHRMGPQHRHIRSTFIHWGIYCLGFGLIFSGMINNAAHIGGLIGGIVIGMTADLTPARRTVWTKMWDVLFALSIVIWIATLVYLVRSIVS